MINSWRNKKGGHFGETKMSTKNPNRRLGAIYPWVPEVNYKRVTFTDGEYQVREYKQGCDVWRQCANLELHRHAREREKRDIARERNKEIMRVALRISKENKERDRETTSV